MDTLEKTTAESAPSDTPMQSNLGMKLFAGFIVLIGALLIIDLLRALFRF